MNYLRREFLSAGAAVATIGAAGPILAQTAPPQAAEAPGTAGGLPNN
jgi:hypothetical protein